MSHSSFARHLGALGLLICVTASAQDAGVALELPEVQSLAVAQQPMLQAQIAAVKSARENAVAAAQLPDPKLAIGITDLPIDGPDRYSLRRDNFTMYTAGVMQDFPLAQKRRLRGEVVRRGAEMAEQDLAAGRLAVRRDAAMAWLEVWRPERAAEVARATEREADLQAQAVEIAYRTGKLTQAEVLAARVDLQVTRDEVADLEQQAAQARDALSRWIGQDAYRVLCPDLPAWAAPPDGDALLARVRKHPLLNSAAKQTEMAKADVQLARAAYKPDWGVELEYANRPAFADYVSLKVSVDLPIFTANRQDRGLAGKLHDQDRAEQLREDVWRQQAALARQSLSNWQHLQERLARYERDILPQSAQRVEAARLAWQSGQGLLAAVLDARRVDLENRMKQLDLKKDAAMSRLSLQFLAGEQP